MLPMASEACRPIAFRALYDREYTFVWRSLRQLGIEAKDLCDVTHDVFVQVHKSFSHYDVERPFRSWLYGLLFRVASTYKRLHRNRYEVLGHLPGDIRDPRGTPEDELSRREEMAHVQRVLASMDERYRAVLMYELGGEPVKPIAAALALPVKTVYSRLAKARRLAIERARHMRVTEPQ
jgi:RNA polymerase sigma-70 factor (ECF subfamily)